MWGSRIFEELKSKGAEGSATGFYSYLKKIRQEDVSNRIRERYETGPRVQAQFDWSPYTVRIGSEYRKVCVFCIILSFSRYKYFVASFDKTQHSVFLAIEGAFQYFGGVPKRLLMDNAKQMVEEPFWYLENHFIRGGEFKDFDDFQERLKVFTEQYNARHHQGINTSPVIRFEEERTHLGVLPKLYFVSMKEEWRKVNYDCLPQLWG